MAGHARIGWAPVWVAATLIAGAIGARAQSDKTVESKPESPASAMSPTESYKVAMAPFQATRSQPDDLTDADQIALGIGMTKAGQDCLRLTGDSSSFSQNAEQLFALGQLCMFGQQFEAARADLVNYLALPDPPRREEALLMLARAFLGLDSPRPADAQIESLLRDSPYDAPIHLAIDEVVEGALAVDDDETALRLCQMQTAATLPILKGGRALGGKDSSVPAAALFRDAIRCAALARSSGQPDSLDQLVTVGQQPSWDGTADLPVIQSALRRQVMVGEKAPLSIVRGNAVSAAALVPRSISLVHGTALLVPFTLWSPSTPAVLASIARGAPHQTIYAVTSWHANTGGADQPSRQMLEGMRLWQRSLPRRVVLLILPDSELSLFAADVFPAGIVVKDKKVIANMPLSGKGSQRFLLKAVEERRGD